MPVANVHVVQQAYSYVVLGMRFGHSLFGKTHEQRIIPSGIYGWFAYIRELFFESRQKTR